MTSHFNIPRQNAFIASGMAQPPTGDPARATNRNRFANRILQDPLKTLDSFEMGIPDAFRSSPPPAPDGSPLDQFIQLQDEG